MKLRKEQGARQENNEEVQNFVTGEVTGNKRNKKKDRMTFKKIFIKKQVEQRDIFEKRSD